MLRCLSRYRNQALRLHVEPGEVLRDLDAELEAFLLRDAPGCWQRVDLEGLVGVDGAPDAPPAHRMLTREQTRRKQSERGAGAAMSRQTMPGLARPRRG